MFFRTNPAIEWTANNKNVQLAVIPAGGAASEGGFAAAGESVITDAGYALAVKAVTPGVTKLTGMTTDGSKKKVSCTVTVRGQVTELSLKTAAGKNGVKDFDSTKKAYTQYKKYTDTSVSCRSYDTSVLTVNKNGKISVNSNAGGDMSQ